MVPIDTCILYQKVHAYCIKWLVLSDIDIRMVSFWSSYDYMHGYGEKREYRDGTGAFSFQHKRKRPAITTRAKT